MHAPFKVVHQCSVWLELTQTWLYNLVRYLPTHIENHVVCRRARNLEHFDFAQIHALKSDARLTYVLLLKYAWQEGAWFTNLLT